jgi:hypothetical protein
MRVAIRGFADGALKFEERIEIREDELDELLPQLAIRHGKAMAKHELTMIR